MKILFISLQGIHPFQIGGPPVVAYNLIKEFDRKDLEVDLVLGISKEHLCKSSELSKFLGLSDNINLIPLVINERSPASYENRIDFEFLKDIVTLSRKSGDGIQLIHFHSIPATRDIMLPFLAWLRKIPTIYRNAGWITCETFGTGDRRMYYQFFVYKLLNRFFTKVVCNSLYLKEKTMSEGIKGEKIEVIPNGVDTEKFNNAQRIDLRGDPKLLFVGRLVGLKGIDTLVRSMKMIVKELPDAVLHVVGDGPLMNQLGSFTVSSGLRENVVLHGPIVSDLPSFYKSADICVFPSNYEPFGITIIEAMAAGKPLIAARRGGIPENITNHENGILIEPTMMNLTKTIIGLWKDGDLMDNIGKNNLVKARNYDWSKIAERYIALYSRIAGM